MSRQASQRARSPAGSGFAGSRLLTVAAPRLVKLAFRSPVPIVSTPQCFTSCIWIKTDRRTVSERCPRDADLGASS